MPEAVGTILSRLDLGNLKKIGIPEVITRFTFDNKVIKNRWSHSIYNFEGFKCNNSGSSNV